MDCLLSLYRKPSTPPLSLTHKCMHAHTHIRTHIQTHTTYMGIYSAVGHTVGFSKLLDCYALFKDLKCVCVCVCEWMHEL